MKISREKTKEEKGILVAFDKSMQSLILWWYQALRKHSALPIAFINLGGVCENVKKWCKGTGYYYDNERFVEDLKKIKVSEEHKKKWYNIVNADISAIRPYWFAKPIAMMHTPFEKTLYLDIDCEVKDSIDEIFSALEESEIGICKDFYEFIYLNKNTDLNVTTYNSGVIVYKNRSKIIEKWTQLSLRFSYEFFGDQDLLSQIIYEQKFKPVVLPLCWNCHKAFEIKEGKIKILHWLGLNKIELIEKIKNNDLLVKQTKDLLNGKITF